MQNMTIERRAPPGNRVCVATSLASRIAVVAIPALATVLLYARTTAFDLVFDDLSLIGAGGPEWLGGAWLPYRPLRYLSYAVDHALFGGSSAGYHGVNVALHAVAASLVASTALRLGIGAVAAILGGVVFAVHPLGVEATAYVSGRRDLLAGVFVLLALWVWLSPPRRGRMAMALAAALAACAAKESGILAFGLLALASTAGLGPRVRDAALSLAVCAGGGFALIMLYGASGPWLPSASAAQSIGMAGALCTHYFGNLLVPVDLAISYPALRCMGEACVLGTLANASVGAGLLLLLACGVPVCMLHARRVASRRAARSALCVGGFAWILFAVALLIGRHEPGADRHAYPLLAFFALLVADIGDRLLHRLGGFGRVAEQPLVPTSAGASGPRRWAIATSAAAVVPIMALIVSSVQLSDERIDVWRDERSLWTRTVVQQPRSARAHYNLAAVLWESGDRSRARVHLRRASRLDPRHVPTHLARAAVECEADHAVRARRFFDLALDAGADWRRVRAIELICPAMKNMETVKTVKVMP